MFKNEIVQTIVNLEKQGVLVYLTEEGWKQFIRLVEDGAKDELNRIDVAG